MELDNDLWHPYNSSLVIAGYSRLNSNIWKSHTPSTNPKLFIGLNKIMSLIFM